jgi:hypothetical protein
MSLYNYILNIIQIFIPIILIHPIDIYHNKSNIPSPYKYNLLEKRKSMLIFFSIIERATTYMINNKNDAIDHLDASSGCIPSFNY